MKRLICIVLVMMMLWTSGCGNQKQYATLPTQGAVTVAPEDTPDIEPDYHFSKMKYVRPDVQTVISAQKICADVAAEGDWEQLRECMSGYIDLFNSFETMHNLSRISYNLDLSDTYWEEEFTYCSEGMASIQSGEARLMVILADCDFVEQLEHEWFGQGYFKDYEGIDYLTDEFDALLLEETQLQNCYYTLSGETEIIRLLCQLVAVRQRIAAYAGYDSYSEFAFSFYYKRDYDPHQAQAYLEQIRTEVAPVLVKRGLFSPQHKAPKKGGAFGYVKNMAEKMGGNVEDAFTVMETGALYDIERLPNKMAAAYTVFLKSHGVPYVFVDPLSADSVNGFAHEFGHFCQGYTAGGMNLNADTSEVFSQGMEYLSIVYGDGTQKEYLYYKLLYTYVTTAAQSDFEFRLYALPEEDLTVEAISQLYTQVGTDWGLTLLGKFCPAGLAGTMHFTLSPLYILSYTVSNDVAMQLYEMELQAPGAGMRCYQKALSTGQTGLLSFVEEAGLTSPFAEGRVQEIRNTWVKLPKQ